MNIFPSEGTLKWMAPELLLGHPHTPSSDVYAFGSVLYCLIADERVQKH